MGRTSETFQRRRYQYWVTERSDRTSGASQRSTFLSSPPPFTDATPKYLHPRPATPSLILRLLTSATDRLSTFVASDATKKNRVFRCHICPGCESSESEQPTSWTRDLNSVLNIRQLALKWMNEKTRPAAFCRAAGLSRTSPTGEEKTGLVDISVLISNKDSFSRMQELNL